MANNLTSALIYIISALTTLYLIVLLLRFWLPWVGADFRNPVAQILLKLTSPLVIPVRRIVPSFGRLDTATVLVAFIVQYLSLMLVLFILGRQPAPSYLLPAALLKLVTLSINIFMFAIIIRIVMSWLAPGQYNPAVAIADSIAEPILRPFRKFIPPIGGMDISPIFAIILLGALSRVVAGAGI